MGITFVFNTCCHPITTLKKSGKVFYDQIKLKCTGFVNVCCGKVGLAICL